MYKLSDSHKIINLKKIVLFKYVKYICHKGKIFFLNKKFICHEY